MRSVRSPRWGLLIALVVALGSILPGTQPQSRFAAVAQAAGPDLYIKDTSLDTGIEPNPDTGPMWESQDIWVRTSPDPNYSPLPFPEASPSWTPASHQSAEYRDPKYSTPNYVYVRVRNRGDTATSGTERLRVYWTKASASLAWPTQWNDYLANNCGPTDLYGAEITKPRKNAATATAAERAAYVQAIKDIGTVSGLAFSDGISYWHKQNQTHRLGPPNRHASPAFLPWHRELINRYEALLQEANPTVKLLYWDWTTDPENSTGGFNFFTSSFMGASGRSTSGVSAGLPFLPSLTPIEAPFAITRNLGSGAAPASADSTLLANSLYQAFAPALESPSHNLSHGYIGGGSGNMSYVSQAAQDPFFFLLHTNADRLWAKWQRNPANLGRLSPATAYNGNSGSTQINTAMAPWNGTGTAVEPWTTTGGYIVSKTPKDPSVVSPPIYDDAPLTIPVLQPGEAVVLQIPWYPPNPAKFGCFGGEQKHFCLLARVETNTAAPFGMTFAEVSSVGQNTKNNNNIAWKNISVVDDFAGAARVASNVIRNLFTQPVRTTLQFANTNETGTSFFTAGRIQVDLKQKLFDRWRAGGQLGKGVRVVGPTTIEITGPDAQIENITLDPGELQSIDVQFVLNRTYQPLAGTRLKWRLIQRGTLKDATEVVGGQLFEIDLSKLVLVKPGSEWRYLDSHITPGASWTTLGFDDSGWRQGRGAFGYGNIQDMTISPGTDSTGHRTTYFRHVFELADPTFYRNLLLRLKRDDGAVVYLNGSEIARVNLPAGALAPTTPATRDVDGLEEQVWWPLDVSAQLPLLRQGNNVIAVEIHQGDQDPQDLMFDLELSANNATNRASPDVAFKSPLLGAVFQGGQDIPITVEALDSNGSISRVTLFANGQQLAEATAAPFTFVWRGAALGTHRLRAVVTDNDGQQTVLDQTISVLNNLLPEVVLDQQANGGLFKEGDPIVITAQAFDPAGAVQRVEFRLQDGERFDAPEQVVGQDSVAPYSVTLTGLAPGHYMLTAVVFDNQGASSRSVPIHLEVIQQGGALRSAFICQY